MTRWSVTSLHAKIEIGASLLLVESPQIEGGPYARLKAGDQFTIEFPNNERSRASVLEATKAEMVIEMSDTSRWRLTPWTQNDFPMNITVGSMHSEKWVIRGVVAAHSNSAG
jgi:hypothetical protein